MTAPTPEAVARFLGKGDDPAVLALAGEHLPIVTAFVQAYVRDQGFDDAGHPAPPLAAVITSATARLVANPEHVAAYTAGDYSERPAVLDGWVLPELAVLHRYRKRAL
ncbi:hypothetical protein [Arsenicicoccus dermatophilus]|uniref:hypothetical protein n=1 Tax=Arsenicicoccus dermatophilus TaxID=1076331 RepID=UPI003916E9D3